MAQAPPQGSFEMSLAQGLRGLRVAVSGANGFVGRHLLDLLARNGATVTALSRRPRPSRLDEVANVVWRPFDLLCPRLEPASVDVVVHLAAYGVQSRDRDFERAVETNVLGSLRLVQAAAVAGAKKFVYVGSSHEYGGAAGPIGESAPLHPHGMYGASKAAGLLLSRTAAKAVGMEWLGLRPFVTFGPGEDAQKLLPYVILCGLREEPAELSSGKQVRDFTFVTDMVEGLAAALTTSLPSGLILNLGSGEALRLQQVVERIRAQLPTLELRFGARPERADDIAVQVADTKLLRRHLPRWRPRYSLDRALRETIAWYRANNAEQ